jgi:hypothetical protein
MGEISRSPYLHMEQLHGRQCVEAFTPTARGFGEFARFLNQSRIIRRAFDFMRLSCARRSARAIFIILAARLAAIHSQLLPAVEKDILNREVLFALSVENPQSARAAISIDCHFGEVRPRRRQRM